MADRDGAVATGDVQERRAAMTPPPGGATATVRRIVVLVLLFVMVEIGAAGVAGLLARLFDLPAQRLAGADIAGLALNLAFAVIAVPLAALLWVGIRRSLRRPGERSSVAWGLYIAALRTISLVSFSTALLSFASAAVRGEWAASDLAGGVTWLGVWAWHMAAARSPVMGPTRLVGAAPVLGAVIGVLIGAGGAATALTALFDAAVRSLVGSPTVGGSVGEDVLTALVWTCGGAVIWWWQWRREDARAVRSTLAAVAVVALGGFLSPLAAIGGAGTVLYVLGRWVLDRSESAALVLEPLGVALALLLVGATLWQLYGPVLLRRTEPVRRAARLMSSGVALVAAAIGVGVLVNAILAGMGTAVGGQRPLTLLIAGVSALVVGAPAWWLLWHPFAGPGHHDVGRRVYLVVIFGASAVVALITLLVIGYRIFQFVLGSEDPEGLLDRVRAPVGLLTATALVAGYHFGVWVRDRRARPIEEPRPTRVRHVYLVAGDDGPSLATQLRDTGAAVTLLARRDGENTASLGERMLPALAAVDAPEVLVLAGPGERLEVIPLEDAR